MSEPSVDFELAGIKDDKVRQMFDHIRRWFDYREDRRSPSMQTFTGELENLGEINIEIPGVVYGYSGMTTYSGLYWIPMIFSTGTNRCYFGFEPDNTNGSFVQVKCGSTTGSQKYRVTIFYRDE